MTAQGLWQLRVLNFLIGRAARNSFSLELAAGERAEVGHIAIVWLGGQCWYPLFWDSHMTEGYQ